MTLTKSQKVYVAILSLALAAFVADGLFFGEGGYTPQQAQASSEAIQLSTELLEGNGAQELVGSARARLAKRLDALYEELGLSANEDMDAFVGR